MRLSIAFGICAGLSSAVFTDPLYAQPASEILNSPNWSKGTVITDGGAVYDHPDFDAQVVEYLGFQSKVYILKKAVSGGGGMGLFHRVRYKNKGGYMADTDLRLSSKDIAQEKSRVARAEKSGKSGGKSGKSDDSSKSDDKPRSKAWEQESEEALGSQPIYFRRYVGAAAALVNFTEKFSNRKLSDKMVMGGLRLSGPGVLFDGPPLDVNLWFSLQKPEYYSSIQGDASGFLLFGDIMPILPLINGDSHLLYYGIGMMWTYTNYKVNIKNHVFDSQEVRIGFDFDLGYAQKVGSVLLRGDVKYYWEKTQYLGYLLSVQGEY